MKPRPHFSTSITLSPSPETLLNSLSPDERIATDLLFEDLDAEGNIRRADAFAAIVPDEARRRYLVALIRQFKEIGITITPRDTKLDEETAAWNPQIAAAAATRRRVGIK
jgi:hypothetical protein